MTVRISTCVAELIRRAARGVAPVEACGLLFGEGDSVTAANAAANVAADPLRRFEIDPAALFAALKAERAGRARIAGCWHSHPSGPARPSASDLAMAAPDGKLWLIHGEGKITAWRASRVVGEEFNAVPFVID